SVRRVSSQRRYDSRSATETQPEASRVCLSGICCARRDATQSRGMCLPWRSEMAEQKLVGQNYSTPDLRAKVTGRARYSEDFRVPGTLLARFLLSRSPHARGKSIDPRAALALPGVKAILTADEVPGPKDQVNDAGQLIKANPNSEKALTNEPLYQGEP